MRTSASFVGGLFLAVSLLATVGCGGSSCNVDSLVVTPPTATLSHTAAAPGNSQTFNAVNHIGGGGGVCTGNAAALRISNWTVSDPSVHLSSSPAPTVTATCTAAVTSPVTVTATSVDGQNLTGQASLNCN